MFTLWYETSCGRHRAPQLESAMARPSLSATCRQLGWKMVSRVTSAASVLVVVIGTLCAVGADPLPTSTLLPCALPLSLACPTPAHMLRWRRFPCPHVARNAWPYGCCRSTTGSSAALCACTVDLPHACKWGNPRTSCLSTTASSSTVYSGPRVAQIHHCCGPHMHVHVFHTSPHRGTT